MSVRLHNTRLKKGLNICIVKVENMNEVLVSISYNHYDDTKTMTHHETFKNQQ